MRRIVLWLLLLLPVTVQAANWSIIPEKSRIEFTAMYGKDKIVGQFPKFSGDILFDPENPERSKIQMRVDIVSVTSEDKDAQTYLPMAEWFAAKQFPEARYDADHVKKLEDGSFEAQGNLTIRDKTVPMPFRFTLSTIAGQDKDTGKQYARVNGNLPINRLDFGVGQGEWAATDIIANGVQVQINIEVVSQ
jgi:polyisoprenoid-binding protein YceI